jgi:hypothetical protein
VRILAALRGCSRRTVGADAKAVLCRLLGAIGRTCARHKAAASSTEMLRARMRTGVAGCEHGNVLSGILRKSSGSIFLNFESQFFFKTAIRQVMTAQGPSWGYIKVNFSETLSIFGDKRQRNGSNNGSMAPSTGLGYPHIGPFVDRVELLKDLKDLKASPGLYGRASARES